MVKAERYAFGTKQPNPIRSIRNTTTIEKLERAKSGAWFATIGLTYEFYLDDGRKVRIEKSVRVRGGQTGKRPNPNAFGRAKTSKKRVKK